MCVARRHKSWRGNARGDGGDTTPPPVELEMITALVWGALRRSPQASKHLKITQKVTSGFMAILIITLLPLWLGHLSLRSLALEWHRLWLVFTDDL